MRLNEPPAFTPGNDPEQFLRDLTVYLRELSIAWEFLAASDKYKDSFITASLTFTAGEEKAIVNKRTPTLMNYMIPVSVSNSDALLTKGATAWTKDTLYVKNQGSSSVTAKILFFR